MTSRLIDTDKGTHVWAKRTICEKVRSLYDLCVCKLALADPVLLAELTPLIEEIFVDGIKMNKKLCEYKYDALAMFPEDTNAGTVVAQRKERIRLVRLIQYNNAQLKAIRDGDPS